MDRFNNFITGALVTAGIATALFMIQDGRYEAIGRAVMMPKQVLASTQCEDVVKDGKVVSTTCLATK